MNEKPPVPQSAVLTDRFVSFAVRIADIVDSLPDTKIGSHIGSQLLRSGTSPAPNYAEAISAESPRDFIHKLGIALKELRETHVWLKIIAKKGLLSDTGYEPVLKECNELTAILTASVATAKRNLSNTGKS